MQQNFEPCVLKNVTMSICLIKIFVKINIVMLSTLLIEKISHKQNAMPNVLVVV